MVKLKLKHGSGFTIVELLIVIVVIGILAAIVIVAYNGIQARAQNTVTASAVEQVIKSVMLYKTDQNSYPGTDGALYCATTNNTCTNYDGTVVGGSNTSFMSSLATYGSLPTSVAGGTKYYGMNYKNYSGFTLDNVSSPVMIMFWLNGTNQDCQATTGSMVSVNDSTPLNNFTASRNDKSDTGTGQTRCYLMFRS